MAEPLVRNDLQGPVAPTIHASAVIAPGAVLIGQVTVGAECFIGPNAVLRGDIEAIVLGRGSNVQDNCTLHTEKGKPVTIGRDVSIGHGAVVHGATLEDGVLIGMNAVVLNGAVVGSHALVGALSLVPEGFQVPPRSLAVGAPCRIVKQDDDRMEDITRRNTERYHRYRREHLAGLWETVVGPRNYHPHHGDLSRPPAP